MINKFLNSLKYLFFSIVVFFSMSVFPANFNDNFSLNVNGCVQTDYLFWHGEKHDEFIYGGYFRSADFFASGFFLNRSLNYFVQLNLVDYTCEDILSQAYVGFFYKYFNLKIGQFLLPFGLEQASIVYDRMFLETSLLNGMGDGKFFGMSLDFSSSNFCFFSSFVIPELKYSFSKDHNFKYILSFRTFVNFFKTDDFVCHLGVDYKRIKEDQKGNYPFRSISYRDNPCFKTRSSLLNAYNGVIVTSDLIDIEIALMWKSLLFQTELGFVDVGWRDFDKEIYSSFYFQFSYFLNSVWHRYDVKNGCFCNPRVMSSYGSLELLFKYCIVDMINYGPLLMGYCQTDGRKESLLFGLNWLVSDSLKLQLNFVLDEFMYCKSPGFQIAGAGFRVQLLY